MAQINLTGSVGVPGTEAILGNFNVVFTANSNHTLTATEWSNQFLNVTSNVMLTSTLQLIAPLIQGQTFLVQNKTTGGQGITIIGATGSGVTVANGATTLVTCDGMNYLSPIAANSSITLSGDVTGPSGSNTVINIQGTRVSNAIPTNGQVLEYNSSVSQYVPTTLSASGVTWSGDLLGSTDSIQYVGTLSGNSGSQTNVDINAAELRILNSQQDFLLTQEQKFGAVGTVGHDGYTLTITSQKGQVGGTGLQSGNGGDIVIQSNLGGSGSGSIAGDPGDVTLRVIDNSASIGLSAGVLLAEANDGIDLLMSDNSAAIQLNEGIVYLANTIDGYTSTISIQGNYPSTNDDTIILNAVAHPGHVAQIQLQVAGTPELDVTSSGITIPSLGGSGAGIVAVSNAGLLSYVSSPGGITWTGDLAGSDNAIQYVAALSGPGGAGGTIDGYFSELLLGVSQPGLTITQTAASSTSGVPANGANILIQPQGGQPTTDFAVDGGTGGSLLLYSGPGATGGGGGSDPPISGQVIVGDGISNAITVTPGPLGEDQGTITLVADESISWSVVAGVTTSTISNAGVTWQNNGSTINLISATGVTTNCGLSLKAVAITGSSYTLDSGPETDYYLMVNHAGAVGIALTSAAANTNGRTIVIKDASGAASTNNITITPSGAATIDGAGTYVINVNYGSVTLAALHTGEGGGVWYVVGEYNGTII